MGTARRATRGSGCAVAVTAWATIQVRPLLAQRERLSSEIAAARTRIEALGAEERNARARIAELEARTAELTNSLEGARKATPNPDHGDQRVPP